MWRQLLIQRATLQSRRHPKWAGLMRWLSGSAALERRESGARTGSPRAPDLHARPAVPRTAPNEVFTPTRPRAGRRALVGRQAELTRIMQAISEESAHVVLYAERGRGKTSLANLAVERLRRAGFIVGRYACDAASDFDGISRGLLRDVPASLLAVDNAHMSDSDGCASILPSRALTPADIAAIPTHLACPKLVFVIDEFDRVQDSATRTRLADTIKLLSDRGDKLLFMIVGVSTTLEHILGQHPSIERNITALHLPLLSDAEIVDMLVRGGAAAGIEFADSSCASVAAIARGMPYMAQLLGLRIAQLCVQRNGTSTQAGDVEGAIDRLIADAAPDVAARYADLVARAVTRDALLAAASAPQNRWGAVDGQYLRGISSAGLDELLAEHVLVQAAGAPGWLQPADRRLMQHTLLRTAQAGLRETPGARSHATRAPRGMAEAAT
jgi:hypothetical protein